MSGWMRGGVPSLGSGYTFGTRRAMVDSKDFVVGGKWSAKDRGERAGRVTVATKN